VIYVLETTYRLVQTVDPTVTLGDYAELKPTPFMVRSYPPIAALLIDVIFKPITVSQILSA
jgi:hypothetical protein